MDKKINPRQLKAINTKKRIYDVTKMLVDTYGIDSVSIRRIAREADISTGTFYRYYSSKDEVIYNMLLYISEKFLSDYKKDLKGKTYIEMLHDFIVRDMNFRSKYTKLYKNTLRQILKSNKSDYHYSDYLFSDANGGYAFMRELISAAKGSGEIPPNIDADELCLVLQSIIWGLADLYALDDDFDITGYTSRITKFVLDMACQGQQPEGRIQETGK